MEEGVDIGSAEGQLTDLMTTADRARLWNNKASNYIEIPVEVDGRKAKLVTTEKAVIFEYDGDGMSGVSYSAVETSSISGDSLSVAYLDGSSIKSIRVSPLEEASVFLLIGSHQKGELELAWNRVFDKAIAEIEVIMKGIARDTKRTVTAAEAGRQAFWIRVLDALGAELFGNADYATWPEKFRLRWEYLTYAMKLMVNITGYDPVSGIDGRHEKQQEFIASPSAFIDVLPADIEPTFVAKGKIEKAIMAPALGKRVYDAMAADLYHGVPRFFQMDASGQLSATDFQGAALEGDDLKSAIAGYRETIGKVIAGL